MEIKPITRREMFLAKMGGQDVQTPTPITRKEMFLQKIAENVSGGSGGGVTKDAVYVLGNMSNQPISEEDTVKLVDAIKSGKDVYQYMPYHESSGDWLYLEKAKPLNFGYTEFDEQGGCNVELSSNSLMASVNLTAEQVSEITAAMVERAKNEQTSIELSREEDKYKLIVYVSEHESSEYPITAEQFEELLTFYEEKFGTNLHNEE